ncbi:MAG: hypothetical protein CMK30_01585 [Porticoccaceae bacterium]|nr:hypothetical protein [Porticoccaceae bacterium]|tara:strand:- start:2492 stop:2899 length:408 start_codon:yes stop_codon:yes gene_type:complete
MREMLFFGLLVMASIKLLSAEIGAEHDHINHTHEESIDGDKFDLDPTRFNKFINGLSDVKVAVVSVNGMVCDFCARGIEKTFKRNAEVRKVDVDLGRGKVLIAFSQGTSIDFEYISRKILENGQTATKLAVLEIR